ncbi:SDR family oxidoreductase [Streptomyces sp. NA04227]|uniref:SDR family NAD(P)-dependent oxidoreductase n=1 Tax=Streptomyces sp. NA04227 TaxID=2742136 RepID=UPI001592A3DC|nr:SDR family NAD(P)-dependent oxidoreductase [Streptomyces sp. NA04227]QKW06735.1 SDR family oxidoreductase [Streptomyces sp. NA04227]
MRGSTNGPLSRRAVLGGAATAATGLAVGAASARAADGQAGGRGRYAGKTVLVTGGTKGIGRAMAVAFAREGAKVGFCGRTAELGRAVEREIREAGGEATYIRADVRQAAEVAAFVDRTVTTYGGLDVALNNAGVQRPFTDLHEVSVADWDDVHATNIRGVFLAMKYEIPHMRRLGGGVIVVTGSSNQFQTRPGLASYTSSKNGVTGLVQAAAIENGPHGIRVVALAPGITDTPMLDVHRPGGISDGEWARLKADLASRSVDAFKRAARPEEIATAALGLASPDFGFQTGSTHLVDGGQLAGL